MSKIEVNGNNNQIYSYIKGSAIGSKNIEKKGGNKIALWSLICAIVAIIVAIIVGWNQILEFFGYAG